MRLGVNVDHVATVRQARRGRLPDPVEAAQLCERAGAHGIVCHLREDRRHIQEDDVKRLRKTLTTRLNLEMSIARDVVRSALAIQPQQVTLVPERRQELTTEGGLDAVRLKRSVAPLIRSFRQRGITVSLFVDPVRTQLEAAREVGAAMVELHTGHYANARSRAQQVLALEALRRAAQASHALGLRVAAGHGLDYHNVSAVARLPHIEELNIGFSIISRALFVGLEQAVREMVGLMRRRPSHVLEGQAA